MKKDYYKTIPEKILKSEKKMEIYAFKRKDGLIQLAKASSIEETWKNMQARYELDYDNLKTAVAFYKIVEFGRNNICTLS